MVKSLFTLFILIGSCSLSAQQKNILPGLDQIRLSDLKEDLYELASAKFKGRSAGTLDELNAAAWLAGKYHAIGLKPAGDNGTYFQFFTMWRNHISEKSTIQINDHQLVLWKEAAIAQMADAYIDAPIIYLGNALNLDTSSLDIQGKVVALEANGAGINRDISLPTWRYNRYIYAKYGLALVRQGAKAIIFIADEIAEQGWADAEENFVRGTYDIEGGPNEKLSTMVPVIWLHSTARSVLEKNKATIKANLVVNRFSYPSVNVIGSIGGTDEKLKDEYLLYSGHTDAHGIRNEIKNDSIYYGADDNASVNVAVLANARAFVKYPAKRSVLFVIHGAEERGLLGSRYFVEHPVIPLGKIVAVLNGDMIGRNHPDSAAVLGAIVPHRNSAALVEMTMAANREGPKFKLDTTWDKPTHIEGWYFRSDHLPYARKGIPALMYTTLLHPDYHTPQDNAENIDYPKLKKMTEWMYRTGYKVANAPVRPATDRNFKLER